MTLRCLALAAVLVLVSAANAAAGDRWQRPVDGRVLRAFWLAADRYAPGQHRGVDLGARLGASVRAACGGRVSFAGSVPGGGRTVSVRCGRLIATYQQLGSIGVRRGAVVIPRGRLGTVGRSRDPRSRQSHVHLGARIAASGRYVDPLSLLGTSPPALPALPLRTRPVGHRVPLGPAPARPVVQPVPRLVVRPAPRPVAARAPHRVAARLPAPGLAPTPAPAAPLPLVVWIGLGCVALAVPVGGVCASRRRRRAVSVPVGRRLSHAQGGR